MTWIRIDAESTRVQLLRDVQMAQRALDVLLAYGQLSTAGLGDLAAPTAEFITRSQQVMVDAWKICLDEMTMMTNRLVPLLNDQRAASVVGVVGSGTPTFGSWSPPLIGGSATFGEVIMPMGNPALVEVSMPMGGAFSSSGTFGQVTMPMGNAALGEVIMPMGNPALVETTMTINEPAFITAARRTQEAGNPVLAAQQAALGSFATLPTTSDRLWVAPTGARSMGPYGPSAGYERLSSGIEVPILYP